MNLTNDDDEDIDEEAPTGDTDITATKGGVAVLTVSI